MKKYLLNILRIFISAGLLIYLIYLADIQKIIASLSELRLSSAILAGGAFVALLIFSSFRWQLLTRAYGISIGYLRLFIFYLIGFFFNNFLPTSIGGDVSRAYYLGRHSGNRPAGLGTVLLERAIGLLATLTLAILSLFWLMDQFSTLKIVYFTGILVLIVAAFLAAIMSRRIYKRLSNLLLSVHLFGIGEKLTAIFDTLHFYRDKKQILAGAYALSLLGHASIILMNIILARDIGIRQVPVTYFFLLVPITFVFSLMPSINGIGVREGGYVLLLTRMGVETAQAISLSFLVTIIPLLVSLVGGGFFLFYRHRGTGSPVLSEENAA